jgi:membrane protease YdiL (CAAX protease family)
MNILLKSRYHTLIIGIYAFVYIYFFLYSSSPFLHYTFNKNHILPALIIFIFSIIALFVTNKYLQYKTVEINKNNIKKLPLVILYSTFLIAIPEEILFREIIQTYISTSASNTLLVIVLSALIFGLAHSLNEANGFSPQNWNLKLVIITFIAGLFLSYSFYLTRSLLMPTIIHTLLVVMMKTLTKQ